MENQSNSIMVSVCCITYNHERYVKKCLDGILMQDVDFPYEIIIHDDASTDATPQIIMEYKEKNSIIKCVLQKKNQYSTGGRIFEYIKPLISGKYVAICEGDDYWTDPQKLNRQIQYMEEHPECVMCCHAYNEIDADTEKIIRTSFTLDKDGDIPIDTIIKYGKNHPQTLSMVFRTDCYLHMPNGFYGYGVGDYPRLLYAASCGRIHYFAQSMANYRVSAEGSWTQRVWNNKEKRIKHFQQMIKLLYFYDEYTKNTCHEMIQDKIDEFQNDIFVAEYNYRAQKNSHLFESASMFRKVLIRIGCIAPRLAKYVERKR